MTREEFAKGWVFLIAQPWGRRYEGNDEIAKTQRELYFTRFKSVDGAQWLEICVRLAGASEWPVLDKMADLLQGGPGGHPGPEEAWSQVSRAMQHEAYSVVWTEQMREAFGLAILQADDLVAARMAFKETYQKAVSEARAKHLAPSWSVSKGTDRADQERAILEGLQQGKLTPEYAQHQLPWSEQIDAAVLALVGGTAKRLA